MSVKVNSDRLLPSQPGLSDLYRGEEREFYSSLERVMHSVLPVKSVADKFSIVEKPGCAYESLGTELATLHFYQTLIRVGGYRDILEIGTFIGVSALFLAEAVVGTGGRVISVEQGAEFYLLALSNIQANGYSDLVTTVCDTGLYVLEKLSVASEKFDMIVMDGGKEQYGDMLEPALAVLRSGGLLVVDDVFMQGDTLNRAPVTSKGRGVEQLLARVMDLGDRARSVILPIGDGLLLVHKT